MKIENRTFIVSGGSSGLGLSTVQDLLSQNAYVANLDRNPPNESSTTTSSSSLSSHPNLKFIPTDVTQLDAIQAAVDATVAWTQQTKAPLGGVINCAGVGVASRIVDAGNNPHPAELWDFAIAVNLTGSFHLTRLALANLVTVEPEDTPDRERGVVVFVSSAAAYEGQEGQTAYAATKGAIRSMTLPMARDLARHHIRVVSVAPGAFASNMTAQMGPRALKSVQNGFVYPPRFGQPTEFAQTVRWILDCPYVNGETIRLSGGGRLPGKL